MLTTSMRNRTRLETQYRRHITTNPSTTIRPNESKRWSRSSSECEELESREVESSTSGDDRRSRNDGSAAVRFGELDIRYEKCYVSLTRVSRGCFPPFAASRELPITGRSREIVTLSSTKNGTCRIAARTKEDNAIDFEIHRTSLISAQT